MFHIFLLQMRKNPKIQWKNIVLKQKDWNTNPLGQNRPRETRTCCRKHLSVKLSVESVVESLVSRYVTHFHKNRGLNEKNAMDEMEISENGPSEFRAEKLLVVAMDKYWKKETKSGQWHFTRQSTQNLINFGVNGSGKTSTKILNRASKYPLMDN